MDLATHLRACMPEAMSSSPQRAARTALKAEIGTDPSLAAAARAALAAIDPAVLDRDHISRVTKTLLEEALHG